MAITIASGASPAQGLYTAIVGGFLVSAPGGSRLQIGGPAGAFIVLVAGTAAAHGMDGLILATMLAGLNLLAIGLLRLGTYIKFIPCPVTVGFTAGIAVIIFASQVKDLLGLSLPGVEPGPLVEKLPALWHALPSISALTAGLSLATIVVIQGLKRWRPHWPGMLVAVAGAARPPRCWIFPVPPSGRVARRRGVRAPGLDRISAVRPRRRWHDRPAPPFELRARRAGHRQYCVRSVRGHLRHRHHRAHGDQRACRCARADLRHAACNLPAAVRADRSPLARFIPLACLAGVLAVVAWNMVEKHAFVMLLRASRADPAVLLATFLLTIFRDLTEAFVCGFALGSVLFIHRMSKTTAVETHRPFVSEDRADDEGGDRKPYDETAASDPHLMIYRISGVFFFGAAASISSVLDRIADKRQTLVLDLAAVPFLDSTAATPSRCRRTRRHAARRRSS